MNKQFYDASHGAEEADIDHAQSICALIITKGFRKSGESFFEGLDETAANEASQSVSPDMIELLKRSKVNGAPELGSLIAMRQLYSLEPTRRDEVYNDSRGDTESKNRMRRQMVVVIRNIRDAGFCREARMFGERVIGDGSALNRSAKP